MPQILRNRSFRNLWAAGVLSKTGCEISRIGFFLYLFQTRESIFDLALLVVLKTLPGAFFAPAAGWLVDRFDKRRLLIGCDLVQVALLLGLVVWPSIALVYVVAGLQSLVSAIFDPGKRAAIPLVVERRQISAANGFEETSTNLMMVFGPLIGAQLFLVAGLEATLLADALTYALSALLLTRVEIRAASEAPSTAGPAAESTEAWAEGAGAGLPPSDQAPSAPAPSAPAPSAPAPVPALAGAWAEILAGWRYLRARPLVLHIVGLLCLAMLFGGIWVPVAPFFIREVLGAPDSALGIQLAAFGVGGVGGGIAATRLSRGMRMGGFFVAMLLAEGVLISVYSQLPSLVASCGVLALWGAVVAFIGVSSRSILQIEVDERYLGRVFSLLGQGENLALLVAMLLAVGLRDVLTSQAILLAAGLAYLSATAAVLITRHGRALVRLEAGRTATVPVVSNRGSSGPLAADRAPSLVSTAPFAAASRPADPLEPDLPRVEGVVG